MLSYELVEKLMKGGRRKKITQALEKFDNEGEPCVYGTKKPECRKMSEQWNGYRKNLLFVT